MHVHAEAQLGYRDMFQHDIDSLLLSLKSARSVHSEADRAVVIVSYTENLATNRFKPTASCDNSLLANEVWLAADELCEDRSRMLTRF